MNRYLSLAVLGFVGLGLAVPQEGQAQSPGPVQVQPVPGNVVVQPGYTYVAPTYVAPVVVTRPLVVAPRVIVTGPVYYPRYWNGYHWVGGVHYRYHR